jgi:hypothetical protein
MAIRVTSAFMGLVPFTVLSCWSRSVTAGLSGLCVFPPTGILLKIERRNARICCRILPAASPCALNIHQHIPISKSLNPVEVIYQTALATIRTAKDMSLVPMHLKCLTLLTAENVHDQNKFEAKHGYFMESSPRTRIGCTPNQEVTKKAHFQY